MALSLPFRFKFGEVLEFNSNLDTLGVLIVKRGLLKNLVWLKPRA